MTTAMALDRTGHRSSHRSLTPTEVLVLTALAAALVAALWASGPNQVSNNIATEQVRVETGQSLWSLAADHPVNGLSTAQTVEVIASLNGLDSAHLVVGETLSVPAQGPDGVLALR